MEIDLARRDGANALLGLYQSPRKDYPSPSTSAMMNSKDDLNVSAPVPIDMAVVKEEGVDRNAIRSSKTSIMEEEGVS